jgi:hypothetical protein
MRHVALQTARICLVPTLALAVVVALVPSRAELVLHLWLLVLLGSVTLAGLAALRGAYPHGRSPFDRRRAREAAPDRFPSLERMEREVALAGSTAHDVHFRLRPTVRALSTELLAASRGLRLDDASRQTQELLGSEVWELVRPDREPPADPRGPGLDREVLERIVARLERLSPGTS